VVKEEEERFLRNLENGVRLLSDTFRKTRAGGSDVVPGDVAFELLATYGIPIEVTEALALEQNLRVDREGFKKSQGEHEQRSRGTTEAFDVFARGPLDTLKEAYHHGSEFLGYGATEADATLIGIVEQGQLAESAAASGDPASTPRIALVLDRTPFYGESGGQIGDRGTIRGAGFTFEVEDTQKDNDFMLHLGRLTAGDVSVGASVRAEVDAGRRQAIRRAHSATHLLHHALHKHLGKHAQQAGSKVEPDRLRFDFANPKGIEADLLKEIERTVNALVLTGAPVSWTTMPIDEAKKLGAMALFGEKYPENVRVVTMGEFSRELCGGTHLDSVSQVGLFKIVSEESVSAGTRRITAVTGQGAIDWLDQAESLLKEAAGALKTVPPQLPARIASLVEEIKALKKQAAQRKTETAPVVSADDLMAQAVDVNGVTVLAASLDSTPPDELRQRIDVLRRKVGTGLAVLLISAADGKVSLAAGLTPDLVARGLHAGQWLKDVAPIVGGGGGGRPEMAQAGGKDPSKIADAVAKALEVIREKLGS
jgi:alanyl-tRNA synthetase